MKNIKEIIPNCNEIDDKPIEIIEKYNEYLAEIYCNYWKL